MCKGQFPLGFTFRQCLFQHYCDYVQRPVSTVFQTMHELCAPHHHLNLPCCCHCWPAWQSHILRRAQQNQLVQQSEVVSELCQPSKMAWSGTPRPEGTTKKPAELCQQDSQRLCMDGSCIPRVELCRKFRSCAWVELWCVVTVARWNLILITLLKKCRPSKRASPVSPWICLKSLLKPIYVFFNNYVLYSQCACLCRCLCVYYVHVCVHVVHALRIVSFVLYKCFNYIKMGFVLQVEEFRTEFKTSR